MNKKHIDEATNEQLDYAVAVAQGWEYGMPFTNYHNGKIWYIKNDYLISVMSEKYHPTTNQTQCGELIDKFRINVLFKDNNIIQCFINHAKSTYHESKMIAACKAFLWSEYPDGMIPIEETKNE